MAKYALYIDGLWKLICALNWNALILFLLYEPTLLKKEFGIDNISGVPVGLLNSFYTFMAWIAIPIHLVAFVRLLMWSKSFCLVPSIIHNLLMLPFLLWIFFSSWCFQESPILLYQIIQFAIVFRDYFDAIKEWFVLQYDMYYGPKPAKSFKLFSIRFLFCLRSSHKLKYRKDNELLNKLFK